MTEQAAVREPKFKSFAHRAGVAAAALALTAGLTVAVAPAAYADSWGYVNCQPNGAPYSRVLTKSYANGSVRHTQTNGTTYSKTYNTAGWQTHIWNAGQHVNSSSTVNTAAWLVVLWSADRYCS